MQCGLLYLLTENGMPKQQGGLSVFVLDRRKWNAKMVGLEQLAGFEAKGKAKWMQSA